MCSRIVAMEYQELLCKFSYQLYTIIIRAAVYEECCNKIMLI